MRIALLQMTSGIDPLANAATLSDGVARAADGGAAMLFAPEMAGLVDRDRARAGPSVVAEADSVFVAEVAGSARRHGLWVHLGSLPVVGENGRWRNRSLVIRPDGSIVARYDKIHLFDIDLPTGESWRESAAYAPGDTAVTVDTPVGRIGLSICYDLRFAPLYAALADAGATILAVPAAFTVPTGVAHWHSLLRARAIDNGCYVIAAAQTGRHADGRETFGHSLVIDPWGEVQVDLDPALSGATGLAFAEIDQGRVAEVRGRLPLSAHRREFTVSPT